MRVVTTVLHDRYADAIDPHPDEVVLSAEVVDTAYGFELSNLLVERMPTGWVLTMAAPDRGEDVEVFASVAANAEASHG